MIKATSEAGLALYYLLVRYNACFSRNLMYHSGAFLAGFVIPYIANWRGRKTAIFVSIALSVISLITMAVSPYIELLIIFLIITGLAFSGFEIMSFVYTAEASGIVF